MSSTDTTSSRDQEPGPMNGLQDFHLNDLLKSVAANMGMKLLSWKRFELSETLCASTITNKGQSSRRILGHIGFELKGTVEINGDHRKETSVRVVLRSKSKGDDWIEAASQLGLRCSKEEGQTIRQSYGVLKHTHLRDMEFARGALNGAWFSAFMPDVYFVASKQDVEEDRIFFFMEYLGDEGFSHVNVLEGENDTDTWTPNDIKTVLSEVAHFHAYYMGNKELIGDDLSNLLEDGVLWLSEGEPYMNIATRSNMEVLPEIWQPEETLNLLKYVSKLTKIIQMLKAYPKTVCHNDFNPRNVCLRRDPKSSKKHLCMYDWELAYIHVPQLDLAEFLIFVLPETSSSADINNFVEYYRLELLKQLKTLGRSQSIIDMIDDQYNFQCVFIYEVIEFLALRLNTYFTAAKGMGIVIPYLPRVTRNGLKYLDFMRNSKCLLQLID